MKKITYLFIALIFTGLVISCESTKVIPENATAAQIIQMGQNAYSSGHYTESEECYKTVIERFGDNPTTYIEAKYELGHIYAKTKQYEKAKDCFNEILELYSLDSTGKLPRTYKKLSQLGLSQIQENK